MVELIKEEYVEDILKIYKKFNVNIKKEEIKHYIDNYEDYIYVYIENNKIEGFVVCISENNMIHIKNILILNSLKKQEIISIFIKHLIFNTKNDLMVTLNKEDEIEVFTKYNFKKIKEENKTILLKRTFEVFRPNKMIIFDFFKEKEEVKQKILKQIHEPFWVGAQHLYDNIINNTQDGKLFILYDKEKEHIISFGTLHDFDEIADANLKPWIGSIYTFRPYRKNRYSQKLIMHILNEAKEESEFVYLSSDNEGMYEKFGFTLYDKMKTVSGKLTQVFIFDTKKL